MRLPTPISCVIALLAGGATAAFAADAPVPRVMSDALIDKGSWRVEVLEAPGRDPKVMQALGGATLCTSAAEAMTRNRPPAGGSSTADKPQCTRKMLEDGTDRAVVEVACTGAQPSTMKSTIVRVAPRSYEISTETTTARRPEPVTMRMKMSYAGPCTAQDAAVRLDQDSPACVQMAGQLAQMDPAKCPPGAGNAQCVESMTAARARMQAMCK